MKIEKYWREALIILLLLLLTVPFWIANRKAPCDVLKETRTVTDTVWFSVHHKPRKITLYRDRTITDTIYGHDMVSYDTIFQTVSPGQSVYIDTIDVGRSRLAYAHLVTGSIDSSIYSLTETMDTVYKTKEIFSVVEREPFIEFYTTARTAGNNFSPGLAVKHKKWMAGYGFDLVNSRHEIFAAYRIWKK